MTALMTRIALIALPLFLLSACGGSDAGNSTTPSAPVAAVKPPAGQEWTEVVSQTPEGGYVMGNPNAPLKLIEYGSRTCPTCGNFGRTGMQPLEQQFVKTGKVSYEFRDFLVHAPDLGVATLGHCVGDAAFFPVLEQMFINQAQFLDKLEPGTLPADFQQKMQGMSPAQQATLWVDYLGYVDFMKQRGVTEQKARACLADPKMIEAIGKITQKGADDLNIHQTPTFILNGNQLENAASWEQLEAALKAAGA